MEQLIHNLKHMDRPVPVYCLTPKQAADFLRKDKLELPAACRRSVMAPQTAEQSVRRSFKLAA
jgi:hypothetical protein